MNIKSILLGTAAGLMVASAAQAADLPGEVVPAAVDYVKVCDAFGAGFFYIPGTETCLDISGRVRFRFVASDDFDSADERVASQADFFGNRDGFADELDSDEFGFQFRADARVSFDARTATEYGTLRSFFRLLIDDSSNSIYTDAAYIQFSYLTVGYFSALYSYDTTLGDINTFDLEYTDAVGAQVLVDDIGGGFFVGAGVFDPEGGQTRQIFGENWAYDVPEVSVTAGIEGQPWGGISIVGTWIDDANAVNVTNRFGVSGETWAVRAVADLTVVDGVDIKLTAAYISGEDQFIGNCDADAASEICTDDFDRIPLSAAISFDATDSLSLYTGIRYDFIDGEDSLDVDDQLRAQIGAVYTITDGLTLTGEVAYVDDGSDDEDWAGYLQLKREW